MKNSGGEITMLCCLFALLTVQEISCQVAVVERRFLDHNQGNLGGKINPIISKNPFSEKMFELIRNLSLLK